MFNLEIILHCFCIHRVEREGRTRSSTASSRCLALGQEGRFSTFFFLIMAHQQHRRAMILVLGFLLIFLSSLITSQQQDELIVTDHLRGKRAVLVTNSDPRLPCRYYGHRYFIFITLVRSNMIYKREFAVLYRLYGIIIDNIINNFMSFE